MINEISSWLAHHYIELLATITGLIYLGFSVKGHILLWPFGILTSGLYVYVYFTSGIYADMGINVYYVVISIYGWIHWTFRGGSENVELPVSRLTRVQTLILLLITIVIFFLIAYALNNYTDSNIGWWDAFTTALSITATWMLTRKILEHWLLWIVVDSVSVGLYVYKGLYITVLLFVVYTTMAVLGYYEWKRQWRKEQSLQ